MSKEKVLKYAGINYQKLTQPNKDTIDGYFSSPEEHEITKSVVDGENGYILNEVGRSTLHSWIDVNSIRIHMARVGMDILKEEDGIDLNKPIDIDDNDDLED